jgi:hypothetical protein
MNGDDDYDFTSSGGNYYQHGRRAYKPLELPSVDWRVRWCKERERAEKLEVALRGIADVDTTKDEAHAIARRALEGE